MSAYPIMLDGASIDALVIGGGAVAERKARALVEAGARVRVVAPAVSPALESLGTNGGPVKITRAEFDVSHLEGATLVFAATNDASANALIAREAKARGIAVNVADVPEGGTFVTPAVHRAGDVVVAVTAGGVPAVAARIRDAVGASLGEDYARAVAQLATLRRALIDRGDRERWREASAAIVADDFNEAVASGAITARIDAWR